MSGAIMQAVVVDDGVPDPRLVVRQLPVPAPRPSEVLVRVVAAGINRAELLGASTGHRRHPERIHGGELAGEVVEVGAEVDSYEVGDRVMALSGGAYAQYACVDQRLAIRVPAGIDLVTAAALPAWYMTAHDAVVTAGRLTPGETVLISGVTSGVGLAAAQIARWGGAGRVIGVARSAANLARLEGDLVDDGVLAEPGWAESVLAISRGAGAGLIIDMVGGGALQANIDSAAIGARIVAVGRLGGQRDMVDLDNFSRKRLRLIGVSFRSRSLDERTAVAVAFATAILPAIADGGIVPLVDRTFPLAEVEAAHEHVRRGAHLGKTLLEMEP